MSITAEPLDAAVETTEGGEGLARPRSSLFRAVWRWHFYAGLLSIPIIVLLCLTGIVYLFKPQLNSLLYGQMLNVTPQGQTVTYQQQLDAVERAYPSGAVAGIATPHTAQRSTQFDLTTEAGQTLSVFVNPYTGQVLGQRDNGKDPANIALALHGSLMTGSWLGSANWGDHLIEIVAGWSLVLVVTGVYLWWPRGRQRRSLRGVLVPRLGLRGRRIPWRDVHAITGVMFSFVTVFFLITGMAWTGFWGPKLQQAATKLGASYPPGTWDGATSKTVGELLPNGQSPWAMGPLPVAASGQPAGHRHTDGALRWDPRNGAPLDAIVGRAQQLGFPPGFGITMPEDANGSYTIGLFPDADPQPNRSAVDERVAYLDQYTAEPLGDYRYAQFGPLGKATDFGISLHEGREWGLASQLLALAGALAILTSAATAIVMWRKRRPTGLGAPRKEPDRRLRAGVLMITAALGALFPLLGLSVVAVLAFDFLVVQRVPALARALGAS
ncbi:MAG: PepSY-associated TM helix domain-containing protein [Egibacteraceae bacterium]